MRRLLPLILLLVAPACLSQTGTRTRAMLVPPATPEAHAYAEELVAQARRQRLAQSRQWLRLGHWRSTWTGGISSEADGDNFFLSPRGRTDPDAELAATLRGFFSELEPYDAKDQRHKNVQHPACQFPARLLYLSRALSIDASRLPVPECPRYREFVDSLRPRTVTLIFSSYYLNNPASAFGHTFLRINKRDDTVAEEKRQLLDFGIDYSAAVDTTFAPAYALKGLLGLFPGVFGKVPFYYKVREYNDFESRDLWEYELTLDERQVEMLVAHIWELGSTFFRYYYVTANCSYHILGVLDVAVPELDLVAALHTPVLPADTVKVVARTPGLIKAIRFRPSLRSQFRARVANLSGKQRALIEQLVSDPGRDLGSLPDEQRIQVLDAAQDLVDIHFAKELVQPERAGHAVELKQKILRRRAKIFVPSEELTMETPWRTMPQLGHRSRRLSLGGGVSREGSRFLEVGGRLAMHDLADPPTGYPELAELEFAPFRLRWDWNEQRATLEQLDLVHIRSLIGQDRFDRKISWEARLGSERRRDDDCGCYAFHLQVGGGGALSFLRDALTFFLLAQTHVWIGGIDGIRGSVLGAGIGPAVGARARLGPRLVALATAEWLWLPDQHPTSRLRAELSLRLEVLRRSLALDLSGRAERHELSSTLSTMIYF